VIVSSFDAQRKRNFLLDPTLAPEERRTGIITPRISGLPAASANKKSILAKGMLPVNYQWLKKAEGKSIKAALYFQSQLFNLPFNWKSKKGQFRP
jgi:hypothetical protein